MLWIKFGVIFKIEKKKLLGLDLLCHPGKIEWNKNFRELDRVTIEISTFTTQKKENEFT